MALASAATSHDAKVKVAQSFLQHNELCLPPFARQLRKLYPTKETLMAKGMVIKAWLDAVPTNIARSERAHGAMRVDLRSVGQGRALAPSSNRMLCRELKAAHVEKGGVDPAPALSTMAIGDEAKLGAGRAAKLNGAHPGNPWLRYLNMKMHSYKLCQGSCRALTDDEMQSVRAAALADWRTIQDNPVQHRAWKALSRGQSALKANRA